MRMSSSAAVSSPRTPGPGREWEGAKSGGNGSGTMTAHLSSSNTKRRNSCHHTEGSGSSSSTRPRRLAKIKHRSMTSRHDDPAMEPPVLSFYGTEPVPLPSRFSHIKQNLVAGHEAELAASWARLLDALRDEVAHIRDRGPDLTPSIDFAHVDDPARAADFARDLRRYGVGVVRGVMPRADADACVAETVRYLETKHDFKPPPAQDPDCFDFFWSPAQVRTRAHPNVLRAQEFAMSLWGTHADDRLATRFPISYADRLRIHGAGAAGAAKNPVDDTHSGPGTGTGAATGPGTSAASAAAAAAAIELLGDFASSTVIAQVDNGSLERWEPDGYGRGGTYNAVFQGNWESYDPWDPTGRVGTTPDLYNGYGACSIFRMYQGVLSLSNIEPGLIRLLPSPKLATSYFLLRPFFSPKTGPPPDGRRDGPEWDAFLDAANWALDREQSTIIHGAVPGHAQRLTELWHPHLHLRRTLTTIPTLQPGDYIMWHPDLAYHITSNGASDATSTAVSRAATPPPGDHPASSTPTSAVSVLVYLPAAPLTQTNALYLARQRKTFQRGHPSPDFDATGSGLGSEASHAGRPGENDIAEIGGSAALQAMGLAPFDVAPTPPSDGDEKKGGTVGVEASEAARDAHGAAAEVARLANIILFPDRYDMYMSRRNRGTVPRIKKEEE